VSVIVILLMFLAVIAMVKKIDEDRQPRAILAADSREAEDRIRLQINKQSQARSPGCLASHLAR
jgi:hypothetical protein